MSVIQWLSSQINNEQINNVEGLDVVMLLYKLIQYSNSYSKIPRRLCQYCRDEQNPTIRYFKSFKWKGVITNLTGAKAFAIADIKLQVYVVTLSSQDNAEPLQQLKSGFRRTIY